MPGRRYTALRMYSCHVNIPVPMDALSKSEDGGVLNPATTSDSGSYASTDESSESYSASRSDFVITCYSKFQARLLVCAAQ